MATIPDAPSGATLARAVLAGIGLMLAAVFTFSFKRRARLNTSSPPIRWGSCCGWRACAAFPDHRSR